MLSIIESVLSKFRSCFSRERTFGWFVLIVVALMQRSDFLGVTSVIRDLALQPDYYECMLNFFRSSAYSLPGLRQRWYEIILAKAPLQNVAGRHVLIGDGVKQSKEARKMPGVKKMVQESETCSKPEFIHGHLFGALGVIVCNKFKRFCLPLKINIQDGLREAADWDENTPSLNLSAKNHIEQIIESAFEAATVIGKSFLLLDRYFLTKTALELLTQKNEAFDDERSAGTLIEIITKAKVNCVAYRRPYRKNKVGRPPKRGKSVKVSELFFQKHLFNAMQVEMYGKKETVEYYCHDLLWGQGLYRKLRFVLVEFNGMRSILVSTDTDLDPKTIIELYAIRFGIEAMFREFKQQIGGFCYRFWTSSMPRLNHFSRSEDPDPLDSVHASKDRKKIIQAAQAIEMYVLCSSVAMGVLQMIALNEDLSDEISSARYLRTRSSVTPSEGTVRYYLHRRFFTLLLKHPDSIVTKYILRYQGSKISSKNGNNAA